MKIKRRRRRRRREMEIRYGGAEEKEKNGDYFK